jgi:type I restriction enzyme S subunit
MSKWPMTTLGSILSKSEDWITPEPDKEYNEVTVRLWGKGVVLRGKVTGSEVTGSRRLRVRANQFILSRIDARNGATGLVPNSLDGAVVTNDFPVYSLNNERVSPSFLNWMSKTATFVELCKRASEGTTNRVRLKEDRFLSTEAPLPPLPEQRRIVARIDSLAAKIEEARGGRERVTVETEALITSTRRKTFSNNQYPVIRLVEACESIIDNLHSNPVYTDEGVPCIRSPDVGWGKLDLLNARKTSEQEFRRRTVRGEPSVGDIVLVREGGGTGKAALIRQGERFSLGQRVMMLRPKKDSILPEFFLHQLLSPTIQDDQIVPLSKGSASPHLNIGALEKFSFQVPSLPDQHRIVDYLDGLQAKMDALEKLQTETAAELAALLPSILDKAFKGEL